MYTITNLFMKYFIISLLAFSSGAFGQNNDLKQMGLKGNIKSITTQDMFRSNKSGVWTEWVKAAGGVTHFNSNGNKTEFQQLKADGSLILKTTFTYQLATKKIEVADFDKDLKPTTKTIFTLNDKGQQSEEVQYSSEGKLGLRRTYEYDEKGNNIKQTQFRADGSLASTKAFVYDSKGNVTKLTQEYQGSPASTKKFVYNESGQLIEEISYDDKGNIDFRFERSYDLNGNKKEEIKYKRSERLSVQIWKYEYDKTGNWTKKTQSGGDEMATHIVERTIVYY